ncbi:MAG TPA: dUTP diphosphatase [Pseudomonadales bacterium]|nr:dUTP diphosphatase [Pseudomonadales bacterium]
MQKQFFTMLQLQHAMNTKVHPHWIAQHFEWYRALWIECGELMDHQGYKWWKKQTPDIEQVKLEIVDIWHFGLSMVITRFDGDLQAAAEAMAAELAATPRNGEGVLLATEALASHTLRSKEFSVGKFWDLMQAAGMTADELFTAYVGKNVLNFFRQDHGYKEGSYVKQWHGREDNEHLVEIVAALDPSAEDFSQQLYAGLAERYATVS